MLAAAVLWGTAGTAQTFAPAIAPPATIGAVRLAFGGAALFVLAEPLTAATLGVVVLGERLTPASALGSVLGLGGLTLRSLGQK